MLTKTNFNEQNQILSLIHKSQKGITYVEIHEAYFSEFGIRLGDQTLEPIIDQLEKDKYITHRPVPGGDVSYYSLQNADDFIATGGYLGKAARDKDMLEHDLRIKELELELEVSKNKIFELENKKTYKGLFISIIVVLLIALASTVTYYHRIVSSKDNITTSDSLKINSQKAAEPIKMSGSTENASQHSSDSITTVVDTIVAQ